MQKQAKSKITQEVYKNVSSHVFPAKSAKHCSRSFVALNADLIELESNNDRTGVHEKESASKHKSSIVSNDSIGTSRRHQQINKKRVNEVKIISSKHNSKVYNYPNSRNQQNSEK